MITKGTKAGLEIFVTVKHQRNNKLCAFIHHKYEINKNNNTLVILLAFPL